MSVAGSVQSATSKHGVYTKRHCHGVNSVTKDECKGKLVAKWSQHLKFSNHQADCDSEKCTGDGCQLCAANAVGKYFSLFLLKMVTNDFGWSNGALCPRSRTLNLTYRFNCDFIILEGFGFWSPEHLVAYGHHWQPMVTIGSLWSPFGSLWSPLVAYGHHLVAYGHHLVAYGHQFGSLWSPIWQPMVTNLVAYGIVSTSNHGKHREIACQGCDQVRRSNKLDKSTGLCKGGCRAGSQSKRSVKGGSKKSVILQSDTGADEEEKQQNIIISSAQKTRETEDIMDIDEGDAAESESLHSSLKDLTLEGKIEKIKPQLDKKLKTFKSTQAFMDDIQLNALPQADIHSKMDLFHAPEPKKATTVAAPVPLSIYSQQEQDHKTIKELLRLKTSATVNPLEITLIIKDCVSPAVVKFLASECHINIMDLILQAQLKLNVLDIEGLVALAFVSVILGGKTWTALPSMFQSLQSQGSLESVLSGLKPLLETVLGSKLPQWISENWISVEAATLNLLYVLYRAGTAQPADIATISRVVDFSSDMYNFVMFTASFTKSKKSFDLLQAMIDSIKGKVMQKLSYVNYIVLVDLLTMDKNQRLLQDNDQVLLATPLVDWITKIKQIQASVLISDVSSANSLLDIFQKEHGMLAAAFKTSITDRDQRYNNIFHESGITPNKKQLAIAQYAMGIISTKPCQLWTVPTGQGKSRIAAATALQLLFTKQVTAVHLVFDCESLMNRDKEEFEIYWQYGHLKEHVFYHVGLQDFICKQGEAIIIDEADELILGDPAAFHASIGDNFCICFTATPDNNDCEGIEKRVIAALDFERFDDYNINDGTVSTAFAVPVIDSTITLPNSVAIYDFVFSETTKNCAVLLYCTIEIMKYINEKGLNFIWMHPSTTIDTKFLRLLGIRDNQGRYPLLIATDSFGMRGQDYRASNAGITLLIAKSFDNQRQSIQGLGRVGRFGDPCKRLLVEGVQLVDKVKESEYKAMLMLFASTFINKKSVVTVSQAQNLTVKKTPEERGVTPRVHMTNYHNNNREKDRRRSRSRDGDRDRDGGYSYPKNISNRQVQHGKPYQSQNDHHNSKNKKHHRTDPQGRRK